MFSTVTQAVAAGDVTVVLCLVASSDSQAVTLAVLTVLSVLDLLDIFKSKIFLVFLKSLTKIRFTFRWK